MNKSLVAITDLDHSDIKIEQDVLAKFDIDPVWLDCKTEEDVIEHCQGYKSLINQYAPITEKVLENLPDLRAVVRFGVGVDNVDLKAATKHNVKVCNVPDYGTNEVADQAMALFLALTRKVVQNNTDIRNGIWDYSRMVPIYRLADQTVGVIGVGRIGTAFAQRAKAFGCEIIVNDEAKKKAGRIKDFMTHVSFDELIERSDVISIHIPLDNNHDYIDYDVIKRMKKTAYLINVSRGGIIVEDDLYRALKEGLIAGAACDVFEKEPPAMDYPLLHLPNFIASSHIAWYSEESCVDLERKVAEEAARGALDQELLNVVNK